ncbi:MAG: hypothetical protein EBZ81_15545 [Betaproteobacteria bacterium]|nr:hypothetical protein [Betaproteobacteria bacterium]
MRELRTPGSVRGVLGNGHPYRDRAPPLASLKLSSDLAWAPCTGRSCCSLVDLAKNACTH